VITPVMRRRSRSLALRLLPWLLVGIVVVGPARAQSAGDACAELHEAYRSALIAAQAACEGAESKLCTARRAASLKDACRCEVAVDPTAVAPLDELTARFQARACAFEPLFCTRVCTQPNDR